MTTRQNPEGKDQSLYSCTSRSSVTWGMRPSTCALTDRMLGRSLAKRRRAKRNSAGRRNLCPGVAGGVAGAANDLSLKPAEGAATLGYVSSHVRRRRRRCWQMRRSGSDGRSLKELVLKRMRGCRFTAPDLEVCGCAAGDFPAGGCGREQRPEPAGALCVQEPGGERQPGAAPPPAAAGHRGPGPQPRRQVRAPLSLQHSRTQLARLSLLLPTFSRGRSWYFALLFCLTVPLASRTALRKPEFGCLLHALCAPNDAKVVIAC